MKRLPWAFGISFLLMALMILGTTGCASSGNKDDGWKDSFSDFEFPEAPEVP